MSDENLDNAFLEVIEANKGIIYKVANSYCQHSEDRRDLVQEITYQLWKSFGKYDDTYKISTWMYRIALNVAISFYRKERNKGNLEANAFADELLYFEKEESMVDERLGLLQKFIYELKELDKALILLYLEDRPQDEIAEILGLSVSNISTKIHRIKNQLTLKFNQVK